MGRSCRVDGFMVVLFYFSLRWVLWDFAGSRRGKVVLAP